MASLGCGRQGRDPRAEPQASRGAGSGERAENRRTFSIIYVTAGQSVSSSLGRGLFTDSVTARASAVACLEDSHVLRVPHSGGRGLQFPNWVPKAFLALHWWERRCVAVEGVDADHRGGGPQHLWGAPKTVWEPWSLGGGVQERVPACRNPEQPLVYPWGACDSRFWGPGW